MFFKKKQETVRDKKEKTMTQCREKWTAGDFYKGLCQGKNEIGSLLFNEHPTEEKIVKQICRYTGYTYKGRKRVLCKHPQATNKFYVTHYMVE